MSKKYINRLFILIFLILAEFSAIGQTKKIEPVRDGFYLINRQSEVKKDLLPLSENEIIIRFSDLFLEKTDPGTTYLVVDRYDFVPMQLSEKPQAIEQEDKRTLLMLTLTDEAKIKLRDFTKRYLNRKTCIVVQGEALTMHKIRTVIDGGKMQITRCTDNACQVLYPILEQNVVE